MSKGASVAIFVPHVGCPHKCSFCDQNAITGTAVLPHKDDVAAACERAIECGVDRKSTEIAFFGGSFTAIPRGYMTELLDAAQPYLKSGFKGIRISTRPDCIDREVLALLKDRGVSSIELGAQSMDDGVLSLNARGHTSADTAAASALIKEFGFTLGLQMMVGLYGSTPALDMMTAEKIISLGPREARIYPTVILKNTRLAELYLSGKYRPYSMDSAISLCADILEHFENAGISVIKLGLHASKDVERDMLGGLYHPAFRELCESLIYRKKMESLIGTDKEATFTVPPQSLSKALGQRRSNIGYFRAMGKTVKVIALTGQTEDIIRQTEDN